MGLRDYGDTALNWHGALCLGRDPHEIMVTLQKFMQVSNLPIANSYKKIGPVRAQFAGRQAGQRIKLAAQRQ